MQGIITLTCDASQLLRQISCKWNNCMAAQRKQAWPVQMRCLMQQMLEPISVSCRWLAVLSYQLNTSRWQLLQCSVEAD